MQEFYKDDAIPQMDKNEGYRKIIARVLEGSGIEVEQKMQWYLMKAQEFSVLDKGQRGDAGIWNQVSS